LGDLTSAQDILLVNWEDVVHDVQQELKRRRDGFSLAYGGVPMDYLLKHFCIRHEAVPSSDQPLEENLSLTLVRVRAPMRYIGMFESIKIKPDSPARSD